MIGTDSPLLCSHFKEGREVGVFFKGIKYTYQVNDWLAMERILKRPVFTFKLWNYLKENAELIKKS